MADSIEPQPATPMPARFTALEALRTDPWLADEYDVLRTLVDQLNRSAPVESASISQTPGAIGE